MTPLFKKADCVQFAVSNLDEGIAFYRDNLGHNLIWRTTTSAGLRMPDTDTEIVLQTERPGLEVDFLVDSADEAARRFSFAGGKIIVPTFDIPIGRCAVVEDPWGNPLVLLDMSKGALVTDNDGNVLPG